MDLPDTVKEYEKNCDFQMKSGFDWPAIMIIHIQGERMKRRYVQHWKGIEDTRVRSLKSLFELYKERWRVKDHEPMDHVEEDDLVETLDQTPMAEELKSFYGLVTSEGLKDVLMMDLPYTTEEYERYKQLLQWEEEMLYTNFPITLKDYEQYCEYVHSTFTLLPIHIMGEKLKKRDLQQWEAVEDIRVRSLSQLTP